MIICMHVRMCSGIIVMHSSMQLHVLLFQQYPLLIIGALATSDLRKVYKAAWDARIKWYNVGLELEMDSATLDTIEGEKSHIDDRFRAMLTTWLRTAKPRPTLTALAEALQSPTVGCGHLTEQILSLK